MKIVEALPGGEQLVEDAEVGGGGGPQRPHLVAVPAPQGRCYPYTFICQLNLPAVCHCLDKNTRSGSPLTMLFYS